MNELKIIYIYYIAVPYLLWNLFLSLMQKILVVDDDDDTLDLVGILLPMHGFTVKKVSDSEDTLTQARIFEPDLILLDINIRGRDGKEICKELKSPGSPFKNIPVILFSAGNNLEKQIADCAADDFIQKPFDLAELVNKIRQYTGSILVAKGSAIY